GRSGRSRSRGGVAGHEAPRRGGRGRRPGQGRGGRGEGPRGTMHELSIALSILDIVAEEAERRNGARVLAVHLRLGPLSGVVKESLRSAYELAREGSGFEGSELFIEGVA